ncbi:YqaA family protein [Chenggangzhangella methanolivorans]|uniref:DedA family protein n=1 Tax=Chenggangzhangella methanolivorans TaxID=1437009 RepID=A0A9E6REG6_9HYPH|nr:YqaA family protein [Chenggangzhangella methanolivorans]QZO02038.1 DedA family protein [Chenggangzhangella methanolivorans]
MADLVAYLGLFASAFAAATILPAQSEALLVGLVLAEAQPVWALVAVASVGNVLGSVVNWILGGQVERFRGRRWFPVSDPALERAKGWYGRWGRWSLLFSWTPIVGDPLTLVAGVLREPFWSFLALVTIAKVGRYVALAAITSGVA